MDINNNILYVLLRQGSGVDKRLVNLQGENLIGKKFCKLKF